MPDQKPTADDIQKFLAELRAEHAECVAKSNDLKLARDAFMHSPAAQALYAKEREYAAQIKKLQQRAGEIARTLDPKRPQSVATH